MHTDPPTEENSQSRKDIFKSILEDIQKLTQWWILQRQILEEDGNQEVSYQQG